MAASKKKVKMEKVPNDKYIGQGGNPDQFYDQKFFGMKYFHIYRT